MMGQYPKHQLPLLGMYLIWSTPNLFLFNPTCSVKPSHTYSTVHAHDMTNTHPQLRNACITASKSNPNLHPHRIHFQNVQKGQRKKKIAKKQNILHSLIEKLQSAFFLFFFFFLNLCLKCYESTFSLQHLCSLW